MTMGDRIKCLRKAHKMTQEDLGNLLGVGKSAIVKYEKGDVENLPRENIVKMASVFDVSPEYILAFSDDEKMGYMTDSMIKEYLTNRYGEETVRFFEKFSSMTEQNKKMLFGICEIVEKAETYDKMLALAHK